MEKKNKGVKILKMLLQNSKKLIIHSYQMQKNKM